MGWGGANVLASREDGGVEPVAGMPRQGVEADGGMAMTRRTRAIVWLAGAMVLALVPAERAGAQGAATAAPPVPAVRAAADPIVPPVRRVLPKAGKPAKAGTAVAPKAAAVRCVRGKSYDAAAGRCIARPARATGRVRRR